MRNELSILSKDIYRPAFPKISIKEDRDKKKLTVIDIIKLYKLIFYTKDTNSKYLSENKFDVFRILNHRKKNKLNISQLAKHFHFSRNTIKKWKKLFKESL